MSTVVCGLADQLNEEHSHGTVQRWSLQGRTIRNARESFLRASVFCAAPPLEKEITVTKFLEFVLVVNCTYMAWIMRMFLKGDCSVVELHGESTLRCCVD